jgi:hypothetical protein
MDDPSNDSFTKRLQAKLAASRFFTFSLLLHVVLVIMGGSVVLFQQMADPPDFVSEGGDLIAGDSTPQAPPDAPPEMSQQMFAPDVPQVTAPQVQALITTNVSTPTFQVAAAMPTVKMPSNTLSTAVQNVSSSLTKTGLSGLPGEMGGRAGGTARMAAMKKSGGKEKSEKAVLAGLRWLVKNQREDGSWGTDQRVAMTGLAVLCFLGHGETPSSPEFGPTVKKGVDYLLKVGTEKEGVLAMTNSFSNGHPPVYSHGIASYALGEYYTMTKDERMKDVLTMAVRHIVDGQAPDGGWQYHFDKGPDSDTSVSGWMIQSLKAAYLTGLNIEGVEPALDKAMLNLKRVQADNGSFGYRRKGDRDYSLTGVGVLCTYFWKGDKDQSIKDGIKSILDMTERKYPVKYESNTADLYAWYYHTQACLMFGGSAWNKWNRWFQDEIADAQSQDGSWPPISAQNPGGELQQRADGDGPVYRTTLCILMLEVFYRYMPTTK